MQEAAALTEETNHMQWKEPHSLILFKQPLNLCINIPRTLFKLMKRVNSTEDMISTIRRVLLVLQLEINNQLRIQKLNNWVIHDTIALMAELDILL